MAGVHDTRTRAEVVASARRVVVKVGSSSLTSAAGGLDRARLDALVDTFEDSLDAVEPTVAVGWRF